MLHITFILIISFSLFIPIMIHIIGSVNNRKVKSSSDESENILKTKEFDYVLKHASDQHVSRLKPTVMLAKKILETCEEKKAKTLATKAFQEYFKVNKQLCLLYDLDKYTNADKKVESRKRTLENKSAEIEECLRSILVYFALLKDTSVEEDSEDCIQATNAYLQSVEQIENWLENVN